MHQIKNINLQILQDNETRAIIHVESKQNIIDTSRHNGV